MDVFEHNRSSLVDYATTITRDAGSAEDVVQDAWLRLDGISHAPNVREPAAYLFRIVRNLAIDARRRLDRDNRRLGVTIEVIEATIADNRPAADVSLAAEEELRIVLAAFAELPERTRDAMRMHRFEHLPLRVVASKLGISVTRAHSLIAEGIAHCDRRRLSPEKR